MSTQTTVYYYQYSTRVGVVSLLPESNGRYKVMFKDEDPGSYHSAAAAADDVSGGHTFSSSDGTDLGELGIPEDLDRWNKRVFANISRLRPS